MIEEWRDMTALKINDTRDFLGVIWIYKDVDVSQIRVSLSLGIGLTSNANLLINEN